MRLLALLLPDGLQSTFNAPRISERIIALMPTGPEPSTSTGVANRNVSALDCVQRGWQSAATRHKRFMSSIELDAARARLQINLFSPAAAQSVIEPVRDAINFALRTARRGFGDQTEPAGVARSMHIEKGDAIAFTKLLAFDVEQRPANLAQAADRDMTGNEWIGNALQAPLLQVNVGAANFRKLDFKQSRVLFEFGLRNFAQFDRRIRLRDDSDYGHEGKR